MPSPPPSPPHPKKPKMSTTSNSSADDSFPPAIAGPILRRPKRRKIAIFLSYCGAGYQGMQKNPGARTIESDLEEALFQAGAVPQPDRGNPKKFDWARAARTDKGVSAAGQVVSGRFYIEPPGLIDRLNSALAEQIRVLGFKRVTGSFNAKKFCDRRRYVYLLPVFALDGDVHVDRESVAASLGSGKEAARCVECSERGRKVLKEERFELCGENGLDEEKESVVVNVVGVTVSSCGYGDIERERFNGILKRYVGTHNFHNFTTRIKAEDPSARRYIVSFNADYTVSIGGIEFIRCEVVGQSFMLHQIRKMVGLAVALMRNCAPESLMDIALREDVNINVPTAPEVGLYLDECFFSSYNKKWNDSHEALTMEAYAEEVEDFKLKHIYPHIAAMEHKEGAVALWLHSLNHRNYPDFLMKEFQKEHATIETEVDNDVA